MNSLKLAEKSSLISMKETFFKYKKSFKEKFDKQRIEIENLVAENKEYKENKEGL